MSTADKIIEALSMPASAQEALVKNVGDDLVRAIVGDHYKRAAPTPPAQPSVVDRLVELFRPTEPRKL